MDIGGVIPLILLFLTLPRKDITRTVKFIDWVTE